MSASMGPVIHRMLLELGAQPHHFDKIVPGSVRLDPQWGMRCMLCGSWLSDVTHLDGTKHASKLYWYRQRVLAQQNFAAQAGGQGHAGVVHPAQGHAGGQGHAGAGHAAQSHAGAGAAQRPKHPPPRPPPNPPPAHPDPPQAYSRIISMVEIQEAGTQTDAADTREKATQVSDDTHDAWRHWQPSSSWQWSDKSNNSHDNHGSGSIGGNGHHSGGSSSSSSGIIYEV